jgi:hypothetical protein
MDTFPLVLHFVNYMSYRPKGDIFCFVMYPIRFLTSFEMTIRNRTYETMYYAKYSAIRDGGGGDVLFNGSEIRGTVMARYSIIHE